MDKTKWATVKSITITGKGLEAIADIASGDARTALNIVEQARTMLPEGEKEINENVLQACLGRCLVALR